MGHMLDHRDSLAQARDAFYTEHHRCGDPDGGLDERTVWPACSCESVIRRLALQLGVN